MNDPGKVLAFEKLGLSHTQAEAIDDDLRLAVSPAGDVRR